MIVYIEIAKRLAQEINAAQDHLDKLQAALAAIQPLVTLDAAAQTSVPRLSFASTNAIDVEDVTERPDVNATTVESSSTTAPTQSATPATPAKRGRPRKVQSEAPAESEVTAEAAPAKRGRPRKVQPDTPAEGAADATPAPAKRGRRPKVAAPAEQTEQVASEAVAQAQEVAAMPARAAKKAKRTKAPASTDVPALSKGFWLQMMGKRKQTIAQIVDRAVGKLGVPEETRPILTNRLSAWLYPSIKSGVLQEAGAKGRFKLYEAVPA